MNRVLPSQITPGINASQQSNAGDQASIASPLFRGGATGLEATAIMAVTVSARSALLPTRLTQTIQRRDL
jgi:hypothetical protein